MYWEYIFIAIFSFLIVFSFFRIRKGKLLAEFIYSLGFPMGSFVWEDLLVFSIYGLIGSVTATVLDHWKYGLLFFLVFWIVRSAGETLYFFLEQFLEPKHFPHFIDDHFGILRRMFGNISYQQCLIIMQVFMQSITMLSVVGLIILLFSWQSL